MANDSSEKRGGRSHGDLFRVSPPPTPTRPLPPIDQQLPFETTPHYWIISNTPNAHICSKRHMLYTFKSCSSTIKTPNGDREVHGIGAVYIRVWTDESKTKYTIMHFPNVLLVPSSGSNLLFVSALICNGYKLTMTKFPMSGTITVNDSPTTQARTTYIGRNLYILNKVELTEVEAKGEEWDAFAGGLNLFDYMWPWDEAEK